MKSATPPASAVDALRNYGEFQKSLRDFAGWLGNAAPGASDLDFVCERNGHFLVCELKPWQRGIVVPYGQHKMLWRLSQQPNTRVYLVGEDDGERLHVACFNTAPAPVVRRYGRRVECWWPPDRFVPSDKEAMRELVRSWWSDASGGTSAN